MGDSELNDDRKEKTIAVVCAYVSANRISPDEVPQFIKDIHKAITELDEIESESEVEISLADKAPPAPAVPIKKSVMPDYIICLEDGRKMKMLKRHLQSVYNLTPEQYRRRWGLPADYPMTAPNYAQTRRDLAKSIGLGLTGRTQRPSPALSPPEEPSAAPPRQSGRRKPSLPPHEPTSKPKPTPRKLRPVNDAPKSPQS